MKPTKKAKPTRADLARKVRELEAQLASTYHFANVTLDKALHGAGSALIVELTWLGGRQAIVPVAIHGGLSQETVDALRADIKRSYASATELKA